MPTTLVLFHSADFDGLCSGAIARKALGDSAQYQGWDYGQDIPDLAPYDIVYLVDISFPRAVMAANAAKLIWIDHHRSAILDCRGLDIKGYRIDGVAACRLAWHWFFEWFSGSVDILAAKEMYIERTVSEPYAVQLLGEFDIWDKRNPDVDRFQLGLQSVKDIDWDKLFSARDLKSIPNDDGSYGWPGDKAYVADIIHKGRTIQDYTGVVNAEISLKRGFDVQFEGLLFRALNIARSNSLTFAAAIRPEHDGCLSYFWDGAKWKISLYGVEYKKDLDLSAIASRFGGGGHKQACGFTLSELPRELGGKA